MIFWNINNIPKIFLPLDSLTCCPEVELPLFEEAFYGLSGGGENHCLFCHLCVAFFIGSIPGSSGRTGHSILELQRSFHALEKEK